MRRVRPQAEQYDYWRGIYNRCAWRFMRGAVPMPTDTILVWSPYTPKLASPLLQRAYVRMGRLYRHRRRS